MSWGEPAWGWALLGVVVLAALVTWFAIRHRARLRARFAGDLYARVLPPTVRARRVIRDVAALLGLAAVVVAAAEPLYGQQVREAKKRGVDLVLIVDLSRSMDARDVDPSRLGRVKREISDLLDLMGDDRVGLVVFAGGAYPRMPLSRDHEALRMLVDELDTDVFKAQGSAVDQAIHTGLDLLDNTVAPADRALVLFSDGEFHDPAAAEAAARDAAAAGVRVYTVGVGDERAPIPLKEGGWLTVGGETVLSQPSPAALRELARATGGAYVPSVVSNDDMRQLYQDEILTTLKAAETGAVRSETWQSGFQWPLGLGLLLLLVSGWVGDGRRALGGVAAVALVALSLSTPARAADRAEGDALYRDGRYPEAVEVFTELTLEHPGDADLWRRLGAARYRAKDFDGAARAFDTATRLLGDQGTDSEFDAGNAHYQAGRLEEALQRYDDVLARDPKHPGALHNKEVVEQELEARRVAAKPPPKLQPGLKPDPQDGQQKQGDPQQLSGQPEPQDGQQGSPQDGQPQGDPQQGDQTQADGQTQTGQQDGQSGSAEKTGDADHDGGQRQPGDDGQLRGDDDHADTPDSLDGLQADGDPSDQQGNPSAFSGDPSQDGPVSAQQAKRLLEGVQEGRPRLEVTGDDGGKPW